MPKRSRHWTNDFRHARRVSDISPKAGGTGIHRGSSAGVHSETRPGLGFPQRRVRVHGNTARVAQAVLESEEKTGCQGVPFWGSKFEKQSLNFILPIGSEIATILTL